MANSNTDLTEEDAADLQFPKEIGGQKRVISFNNSNEDVEYSCLNCSTQLTPLPYIYCPVCNVNICTACFSNGAEFAKHKNHHDYQIIKRDFPLFPNSDWPARDEYILLDALQRYKNWNLVANELPTRSLREIQKHYDQFYLERRGSDQLPPVPINNQFIFPEAIVPYRFKIQESDEPPRYSANTIGYQSLAGYNPARSDFENDFDTNAEDLLSILKPIDTNDRFYEILTNLQCAIVRSYNRRLQERQRWKKIIRDHGLIVLRKVHAWLHRFDLTITKPVYEKLIRFMQFCTPFQFELLMEGLHRSGELKIQILRLCELRQKGITSLADARLYLKLKPLHEQYEMEVRNFRTISKVRWKMTTNQIDNFIDNIEMPNKRRAGFTPIEIVGMPGYEKLSASERELCSNIRLVPITYLELKELLIFECRKMGSIKLKTARKMLKIDVNKTRRLFDFLVKEGFINKSVP